MSTPTSINATVTITINSVAKQFNAVSSIFFDYNKGVVCITDVTGQFYFSIKDIATQTTTIVTGAAGSTTVVMS